MVAVLEALIRRFFEQVTQLGALPVILIFAVTLEIAGEKVSARLLALATALNVPVTYGLKFLISSPRPDSSMALTPSFPSGHASVAFMTAAVLGHRYPDLRYWLVGLASVVGVSRLFLGYHYFPDVLAGSLIGYLIGSFAVRRFEDRL